MGTSAEVVTMTYTNSNLGIYLIGNLAEPLKLGQKKKHPASTEDGVLLTLVAGTGFVQARTNFTLQKAV
jgi:hypothetical protein